MSMPLFLPTDLCSALDMDFLRDCKENVKHNNTLSLYGAGRNLQGHLKAFCKIF